MNTVRKIILSPQCGQPKPSTPNTPFNKYAQLVRWYFVLLPSPLR
jgi:hypothetical protein